MSTSLSKFVIVLCLTLALSFPVYSNVNQGPTVVSTTQFNLHAINFTAATTEAMVSTTPQRNYVNGSAADTHAVTSGKLLKLVGVCVVTKNAGAAVQGVIVRVRVNPTGAVTATSPVVASIGAGGQAAAANEVGSNCTTFNEDITLSGSNQVGISQIGTATAGNDVVLWGYEY